MPATAQKQTIKARERFVPRYLDPGSRLGEILFGLIMVLTITLAAGLTITEDKAGVRELLLAAIGCNVAWGIIDAVLYLMNCITVRQGRVRLVEAVKHAPDQEAALALVKNEVEPDLQAMLDDEDADAFSLSVLKYITRAQASSVSLTREDFYAAIGCFLLVFVACFPATVPFFIFSRPHFALRVSNFLLIALLFLVGQKWARYAGVNRLLAGSAMVAIGLSLVGVAILLGG
jgi:VIT family protein